MLGSGMAFGRLASVVGRPHQSICSRGVVRWAHGWTLTVRVPLRSGGYAVGLRRMRLKRSSRK
eukprot:12350875-Alexandrium_andersonii.AAC.1